MRRGIKGAWVMAGLALLGATFADGREVQAGAISVKIGVGKGGDPFFTYDIYVDLNDATLPQSTPGNASLSVTFTGFTGIVSNAVDTTYVAYQNPDNLTSFWNATLSTANGGSIALTEANPYGPIVGPTTGTEELLKLVVTTPDTPTQTGLTPGSSISYMFTIPPATPGGMPQTGGGTITVFSVPEPSSIVMMLLGGAMLPYIAIRQRRQRSRRVA